MPNHTRELNNEIRSMADTYERQQAKEGTSRVRFW